MTQLNQDRYKPLGSRGYTYGQSDGLYEDRTNGQLCLVLGGSIVARFDSTGMTADLEMSGEARGNILRRGASAWEVHAAKTANQLLAGDGTDIVSQPVTGDLTLTTGGGSLAATVTDLTIAAEARGDILRRDAATWGRVSAKTAGKILAGDGTDITSMTQGLLAEYRRQSCFVNFLKSQQVPIFAKNTMAIVTAVNAQQDFFRVNDFYFELAQGVGALGANTALAAAGLTPGNDGWLLPGDNTATDSLELTRGISLGRCQSFLTGTDAFFIRLALHLPTRANHTHLYAGFRLAAAYETASTDAEALAAYDDKVAIGISGNAGKISRQVTSSAGGGDVALDAAHAAHADGDVLALEIAVSAARVCTMKLGHATPAGTTYAEYEAARLAAIANLATDATWAGTAFSLATAKNVVPYLVYGMAGGAAASDLRLMSFECDYQ